MVLNVVVFIILRSLHATYKYRVYGIENRKVASKYSKTGAVALATWHGFSAAGTLAHAGQKVRPLCSRSRDGGMVAFVCQMMGMKPVRGSSSKGGKEARDEIVASFDDGYSVGITVDGPKGPPRIVKAGIIDVSRKGSVAIVPLTARGDKNWVLGSWDRLNIPKPFSRVAVCYGRPIVVPVAVEGEDFESIRKNVETVLLAQDAECSRALELWDNPKIDFVDFRTALRLSRNS